MRETRRELINSQSFTLSGGRLFLAMKLVKTCTYLGLDLWSCRTLLDAYDG